MEYNQIIPIVFHPLSQAQPTGHGDGNPGQIEQSQPARRGRLPLPPNVAGASRLVHAPGLVREPTCGSVRTPRVRFGMLWLQMDGCLGNCRGRLHAGGFLPGAGTADCSVEEAGVRNYV